MDNFKILMGLRCGLDESSINAIAAKCLFRPGAKNIIPVDVRINGELTFHLY